MRILTISSLYPPDVIGGAERSAANLVDWLQTQGHEVAVLTTAKSREEELQGDEIGGVRIWRRFMHRPYPVFEFPKVSKWRKPLWHLLDHVGPENPKIVAEVIAQFRPEMINIHCLQGIGYNALSTIADSNVPTVYFLHDLGLACIRMSMFKNRTECKQQCAPCSLSTRFKLAQIRKFRRIGFCSPSRANLERLAEFFPVKDYPHISILNANRFPAATTSPQTADHVRFLFVGALHPTKGVDVLLQAAARLPAGRPFSVRIVGGGPSEMELKQSYGHFEWCTFTGAVSAQQVSNEMINSDVLCIPSLWRENSPGVAIQALGLGLPVFGSDIGGIPEIVMHDRNGLLIAPGDVERWTDALGAVLLDRRSIDRWRSYALMQAGELDQRVLGNKTCGFMELVRNREPQQS